MKYVLFALLLFSSMFKSTPSKADHNFIDYSACWYKLGNDYYVRVVTNTHSAAYGYAPWDVHIYISEYGSSWTGPIDAEMVYDDPADPYKDVHIINIGSTPPFNSDNCFLTAVSSNGIPYAPVSSGARYTCECDEMPDLDADFSCDAEFWYGLNTANPGVVDFDGAVSASTISPNAAFLYWQMGDGYSFNDPNNYSYFTHAYSLGGVYQVRLQGLNHMSPSRKCTALAEFCINDAIKSTGDFTAEYQGIDQSCNESSDFYIQRSSNFPPYQISVSPSSSSEPYYWFTYGDGTSDFYTGLPVSTIKTYSGPGTYTVCLQTGMNTDGCKTCMDICIPREMREDNPPNGKLSTGNVHGKGSDLDFISLMPNPATDNVTLELNLGGTEDVKITITDMAGKLVSSQKAALNNGVNKIVVPVQNLNAGVYFIQVASKNKSIHSRFVKQ